jgi:hypothetical protein
MLETMGVSNILKIKCLDLMFQDFIDSILNNWRLKKTLSIEKNSEGVTCCGKT